MLMQVKNVGVRFRYDRNNVISYDIVEVYSSWYKNHIQKVMHYTYFDFKKVDLIGKFLFSTGFTTMGFRVLDLLKFLNPRGASCV